MVPCLTHPNPKPPVFSNHHHQSLFQLLHACSTTPTLLKQAHARILRLGHGHNPTFLTALLRHYTSHVPTTLSSVVALFSQFPTTPPTFAWNLLIRAHTLSNSPFSSILVYNRMVIFGVVPDKFTFPFAVTACSGCCDIEKGKEIHGFAVKTGFYYNDVFLQNALVHLYLKCGEPAHADLMFDKIRVRNVVSWTTLLSGLVSNRDLQKAREVFDAMPVRNVVSWTVMIDGYAKNGQPDKAFEMFQLMLMVGVQPNEFTFVGVLIACTKFGSLELGRWVHDFAHEIGGLEHDVFVGTALIDMYSNCGSLDDAMQVFEQMPVKSVATWNSMITSLGVHGHGKKAIAVFKEMVKEVTVRPDEITFKGVLCACLKDNLVDEGCRMFRYMTEHYGIVPNMEHWNYLAELLGYEIAGHGSQFIKGLVHRKDGEWWKKLVSACQVQCDDVEVETMEYKNIGTMGPSNDDAKLELQQQQWEVG